MYESSLADKSTRHQSNGPENAKPNTQILSVDDWFRMVNEVLTDAIREQAFVCLSATPDHQVLCPVLCTVIPC